MRRRIWLLACVAALLAPVGLAAQTPDAGAIVGRSSRAYRALGSLRADFVQLIEDEMIGTFESRGVLIQAGQNKLSMRFSDPEGDAIVIDGRNVWVYTPSTTPGQVIRMAVPTGPTYGFNILAWLLDRPAERYKTTFVRTDKVGGRPVDVVEMVPISPDLPFSRAVVWLDRQDALPRKLEVQERSGARRTLTLSKVRANDSVNDRTFAFNIPSGVRVVDQ
jgi:outer membrane lipoprotein carrier protein